MTTRLEKPLRREIWINNRPYTLTLTQVGFTLVEKRRRHGFELMWRDLLSGDRQLAAALAASAAPPPAAAQSPAAPSHAH
jgi:hypothetical protein